MYEEFFGLKRSPFKITPDTSLFYEGGRRGDILGALVYAIHRGEGIIKVVGEVGSGKTMLCRMLQLQLPETVEIVYIANPSVSPEDILFVIANELKFDIDRDASKHEVVNMLQNYLLRRHEEDRQVVLFVEEAQGMPLETLEEIRLLSNLETDEHKLLQIILFGQPELDQNLAENSIRQLRERITHDFNLKPLGADEIHKYLNFRMREVGYTGPELISAKLAEKMAVHSCGLLRRINILADKMLLAAFAGGTHTLTLKHLKDAVEDSGFTPIRPPKTGNNWLWYAAGFTLVLLTLAGVLIYQEYRLDQIQSALPRANQQNELNPAPMTEPVVVTDAASNPISESEPHTLSSPIDQNVPVADELSAKPTLSLVEMYEHDLSTELPDSSVQDDMHVSNMAKNDELLTKSAESPKKNQQTATKLDKVNENQPVEVVTSSKPSEDALGWLERKIESSKHWLRQADKQGVSIQVMMRSKSAAKELAEYLMNDWPLDLDKTYLYEVDINNTRIYRVFYNEYPTITLGQVSMKQLPKSVRMNSPYLHSIYRMQQALL